MAERVVIVTGGATGIGRAVAAAFAREPARVFILGRRAEALQEAAEAIGPNCAWQQADVSRRTQVTDAVNAILETHGKLDVLVNNAGFSLRLTAAMPLEEAEQVWDEQIETNLKGAYLMAAAAAPHLSRPGGRIINITSIAAYTGGSSPGALGYASAKAGLVGLTMALARELSPQGITVNAIAPGFIAGTEFTGRFTEEHIQRIVATTPVGRAGTVDEVAAAVLYLASPAAAFITGEVLHVNGGRMFGR